MDSGNLKKSALFKARFFCDNSHFTVEIVAREFPKVQTLAQ
jgi:hypothetical protein